jgi:hypothetical protein
MDDARSTAPRSKRLPNPGGHIRDSAAAPRWRFIVAKYIVRPPRTGNLARTAPRAPGGSSCWCLGQPVVLAHSCLNFSGENDEPPEVGGIDEGRNYLTTGRWLALFPGLAILAVMLGINLVGDWLRDLLDSRLERGM